MSSFPSLSSLPTYPLEETYVNNVIRSDFEGGYVQTRPRYTRIRRIFTINYEYITDNEKATLENFYINTIKGADYFQWQHPVSGTFYNVRFAEPPQFSKRLLNYWSVTLKFEQV